MDAADSDTDIMTSAWYENPYGRTAPFPEMAVCQCCPEKAWFSPDAVLAVSFCIRIYL